MKATPQSRREFIRTATRTVLLGAIGVLGIVLFRRRQNCIERGFCGNCNLHADCSLPWKEARR